jgi:hypothetical protein
MFRLLVHWLVGVVLTTSCGIALAGDNSGWKAGVAKVKITPEQPMWMSGYAARTRPAEGKLHDLWAKALVLEDPTGKRCLLITLDLVGISRKLSLAVRDELKHRYQLDRDAIMIAISHTHSGPVIGENLLGMYQLGAVQLQLVRTYTEALQDKLITLVGEALSRVAAAGVSWGQGYATFAVNRRNNQELEVPRLRELGRLRGPVDHEVPVLAVRDPKGTLRAIVCGYACHATVLDGYFWSGDYPGCAQTELEKSHADAIALFWAGCGADQNPIPRRRVSLTEEYGRQLAKAVDEVLRAPMTPLEGHLATTYSEIDLPFGELPSYEKLKHDAHSTNRFVAARAKNLLQKWDSHGPLTATYPYPVEAWQLGNGPTWIALGGEVVVDYSLRLKKALGPGRTWVAGYTNDVMAYIPSLRVLKEGGYEGGGAMVYYGLPAPWSPRVEELIVAAVKEAVRKVR